MKIYSLLILAAMLITGCAATVENHGQVINKKRLESIKVGIHSKEDVARLLGSPSISSTFNDDRWYYMTEVRSRKPLEKSELVDREILLIEFDDNNKVVSITKKTKEDGKFITPNDKQTPTQGQSLGIIDQAIQNIGQGI